MVTLSTKSVQVSTCRNPAFHLLICCSSRYYQEFANNKVYKLNKSRTIDRKMFTSHIVLLSVTLLLLALIMVLGFLHIGRTIKANSVRLIPMYQADIEQGKSVAENSQLISMNIMKRISSVTQGLERLQAVVEIELRKKTPVFHTTSTQTAADTMDMGTAVTPITSPRITELSSPRSSGSSNGSIITVLEVSNSYQSITPEDLSTDTNTEEITTELPVEHETEPVEQAIQNQETKPSGDIVLQLE